MKSHHLLLAGALLAGRNVDIRLSGDLTNASGTVAGRQAVVLRSSDGLGRRGGGHLTSPPSAPGLPGPARGPSVRSGASARAGP